VQTQGAAPVEVEPAGQAAHEAWPAVAEYELAAQGEHEGEPAEGENCPAGHAVHTAPLCWEPAEQEQVSEMPEPPAVKPAGHEQEALPEAAEAYWLVELHGVQLAELAAEEKVLTGQMVHWPPAAALRKEPGPHTAPKVGAIAMPLSTGCAGLCCSQNMLTTPPKLSKLLAKE